MALKHQMAKPQSDRLAVVTASLPPLDARLHACIRSWGDHAMYGLRYVEIEGQMGVVPAFLQGVEEAAEGGAEIVACLHNDLLIEQHGWDATVLDWFDEHPACLLVGFGGGKGLGAVDIYVSPYDPMQLARVDFVSNLRDAEAHGRRVTRPERVACLDGFSQIGRVGFLQRAFRHLKSLGVVHHAYDSHLGVLARKEGGEVWMLPVKAHHYGGQTAVLSGEYNAWAKAQVGGDHGFWELSHKACYSDARGYLPLRF